MNSDSLEGLMKGIVKPSSENHLSFQRLRKRQRHRKDDENSSNADANSDSGADDSSSTDASQSTSTHRHHRHNRTRTGDPTRTHSLQPLASDTGLSDSNGFDGRRGGAGGGGAGNHTAKAIQDKDAMEHHTSTGKTVGIAVGAAVGGIFLLLIGMMIYMFLRRKKEAAERQKQLDASIAAGGFRSSMSSQDEMKTVRLNSASAGDREAMREARKTRYIYDKDGNLEGEASVGSVGQAGWNYAHYLGAGSLVNENQTSTKQQRQLLPQQPPPAYPRSPQSDENLEYQQYYQQQDAHHQYGQQNDYYNPNQYSQPLYRS